MTGPVDMRFPLRGEWVPADHGYALYAALLAHLPWLDDEPELGVLPLKGVDCGDGRFYLSNRTRLVLRLPASRVKEAQALQGAWLEVGSGLRVGAGEVKALEPFPVLYSPLVVSGDREEVAFSRDVARRLARLGMPEGFICGRRREVRVGSCRVAGFSLLVSELSAEQSLALQSTGLAAGRRFGWGVFVPHKNVAPVGA